MSHTISNSLDLIVEGYSSGCEIEENEDDQYIVWDDKFNCDSESEASNYSDDSDDPSQMLTVTKKEKMLNKLEGARKAKRRKTEAQQNFAELFDEGEILTNKSDIFKFSLRERCKNYNIICIDNTTSFINESVPEKVWMTEEKKGSMKRRRAGAKAETSNGQRRAFKINIARKGPNPLASLAGIVSDHCFTTLTRFPVTETYDIIFAPHCPEDEAENDDPDDEDNKDSKSLKYRQATMICEECIMPKVLKQTQDMIRFAKDVLKLPNAEELYRIVRIFQDGESGPIDNIMDKLAANYSLIERPGAAPEQVAASAASEQAAVDADITGASEQTQAASAFAPNAVIAAFERVFTDTPFAAAMLRYAKLPAGQTNDCQVNDMATLHPLLHAGFASLEFYSLTEAGMQKIVEEHPGFSHAR